MQTNKAFLELGGRPLIERSLEVLRGLFTEVLISSNDPAPYLQCGVSIISDALKGQGPISGLLAGLTAAHSDTVFFVACDMPFIEAKVISYLFPFALANDVVVPMAADGRLHPLHAFYSRACLPLIERNLRDRRLKIIDFYPECRVKYVAEAELEQFGDPRKFLCNVNTPAEWQKILAEYAENSPLA